MVITQVVLDLHQVVQARTALKQLRGITCRVMGNGVVGALGTMLEGSLSRTGIAPISIK
jgi:hypothetical protein